MRENLLKNMSNIIVGSSIIFMILGIMSKNYNVMFFSILIVFFCNICYCLIRPGTYIVFLCFNGMFFLFLLGRPLISILRGYNSWENSFFSVSDAAALFTILVIYLSLLSLHLFASFFGSDSQTDLEKQTSYYSERNQSVFLRNLQLVSLCVFCVSVLCAYAEGLERILFMRTHTYLDMYTGEYVTQMPFIVKGFIQLMRPSLCVFLATFPKKKTAFFVLLAFLLSTLPSLRVGMRSPTMLACVFIFVYYVLRDALREPDEPKWFGRREKILVLGGLPVIICFLLVYTEIRNGITTSVSSKLEFPLSNFLYEQGNIYTTIGQFYDVQDQLPDKGAWGYFFGYLYDCFLRNGVISRLFDIPIFVGQSEDLLNFCHDLKQHLAYAVLGDRYFSGEGIGTSYIIDVFIDYRWIGVVLFNGALAVYMVKFKKLLCRHWLLSVCCLYSLFNLFYIPRSTGLEFLSFFVSPYFWAGVALCYLGAKFITPKTYEGQSRYIGKFKSRYIKQ